MWWKRLTVPVSNETKQVSAVRLWEVRWQSRHGEFYSDTRTEVEAFPSEIAAEEFAVALKNAFKLVRHTSGNRVVVRQQENA